MSTGSSHISKSARLSSGVISLALTLNCTGIQSTLCSSWGTDCRGSSYLRKALLTAVANGSMKTSQGRGSEGAQVIFAYAPTAKESHMTNPKTRNIILCFYY